MPRVALIYDVDGWCWHYQAQALQRCSRNLDVCVDIYSQARFGDVSRSAGGLERYDAILHFSWTESPAWRGRRVKRYATVIAHHGIEHQKPGDWQAVAASELRNSRQACTKLLRFDRLLCVNPMLVEAVCRMGFHDKARLTMAGVETAIYRPGSPKGPTVRGLRASGPKLRVGWCGQVSDRPNTKAYKETVPAIAEAVRDVAEIIVNDRNHTNALTQAEMVAWYQGLDAYLCTSYSEGTPAPILEAAACGLPVISTDVGSAKWLVMGGVNGFMTGQIIDQPSLEGVIAESASAIRILAGLDDAAYLSFSDNARLAAERHGWDKMAKAWFDALLEDQA